MPTELIVIAVTALLAGLLILAMVLVGRGPVVAGSRSSVAALRSRDDPSGSPKTAESTLRVVWWLTIALVLLGVGISGSFATSQAAIFTLGAVAVIAVVVFHEANGLIRRGQLTSIAELVVAIGLVAALLALTGYAASPFAMLFALVAVAAALSHGPRAGLLAGALTTVAFGTVLALDPALATYGPEDVLRLSIGPIATWLLAFVAIAYARHQRRAMQGMIELWRTDPLTGLLSRSQLFATLDQEVSRTRRSERGFCVLMIDVDGLKRINDQSGHLRGDDVLRELGSVIAGSIRAVDSAYRYGGDEFVVLLPETDIVGAFFVAEKIRAGAEEVGLALADTDEPTTSVSIGLVSHPEDGGSAEQLIAAADRAMYEAKKLGKNQISGNPRPRPVLTARRSPPIAVESAADDTTPTAIPVVASEPAPVAVAAPIEPANGNASLDEEARPSAPLPPRWVAPTAGEIDDAEPDAQMVRRQIATASRSFDPDHQIRRAMDAFLSPGPGDRD